MTVASAPCLPSRNWQDHLAPRRMILKLVPAEVWPDATRMTIAAVAAFLATRALHLQGTWAVITTLMITRPGAGSGSKMLVDRMIGMGLGIAVGLSLVTARQWRVPDAVLVALAMLPLCIVVARFKKYYAAPITAMIVLSAGVAVSAALHTAMIRVGEICLGAVIGIAVMAVVMRRSADNKSRHHAGRVLTGCGALLATASGSSRTPAQEFALRDRIRVDLRLVMITSKRLKLGRGRPLGQPQIIALGRLQNDVSYLGRALTEIGRPWRTQAQPALERLADAFQDLCAGTAAHLIEEARWPCFNAYDGAMLALREHASERGMLKSDDAGMALPFLLTRLRADLADLLAGAEA